jgi:probable F420-dependent oxidoreductase
VKIGVISGFDQNTSPETIGAAGKIAEEHGFHSIWVPEHVVFFREYASRYPYSPDGKIPGNPEGVLEPLTALTYLSAHTARIRLGTGICLVPQRNPVYTAKQVADVDFLSGGRVDFGIGIGWLREEFVALDVPWERRAARTRDYVGVMKSLWCDEVSSYKGEFYTLPDCVQNPKPVQKPHPPIFFGGESDGALRRVADLGQGWYGFGLNPETLLERLGHLDSLLRDRGRTREDVDVFVFPSIDQLNPDGLRRYIDLGVDQVILPFLGRNADQFARGADRLSELTAAI